MTGRVTGFARRCGPACNSAIARQKKQLEQLDKSSTRPGTHSSEGNYTVTCHSPALVKYSETLNLHIDRDRLARFMLAVASASLQVEKWVVQVLDSASDTDEVSALPMQQSSSTVTASLALGI
jgi:hypothetical protein